jgi:hypothetical protein
MVAATLVGSQMSGDWLEQDHFSISLSSAVSSKNSIKVA